MAEGFSWSHVARPDFDSSFVDFAGHGRPRAELGQDRRFALAADAKDEPAAAFYRHFGFVAFASKPLQLFLPLAMIAKA
ncbi:hypothetical protein [Shinella sp.]|uniref:hypothetical protein n=1 Tax=Shinella sp. TaxID=1870904 RepID=UPI0029BDAC26|nr:hypothetical protein [Shinella sp.]MDX3978924.1 hypothetical protein [Shinella sp.]